MSIIHSEFKSLQKYVRNVIPKNPSIASVLEQIETINLDHIVKIASNINLNNPELSMYQQIQLYTKKSVNLVTP